MGITAEVSISVREVGARQKSFQIGGDLSGGSTLEELLDFLKRSLISISIDTLREEQLKGFDKKPIVVVDGSTQKSILSVSPLGKVEFVSSVVTSTDALTLIYDSILSRSKVVTGTYFEGNFVFFNGSVVATNMGELKSWLATNPKMDPGNIVRFVNVIPYARKLERYGVTAQRSRPKFVKSRDKKKRSGEMILGPNGVYFLSSRVALREFKNNVKIKFEFISGSTLGIQDIPAITKLGTPLRRNYAPSKSKPKNSGPYLYPSIKLVIGERGIV